MSFIHFDTKLYRIGNWTILRLPEESSAQLPSRGQTMVEATINGYTFQTPLEPDGQWSHWLHINQDLSQKIKAGPDKRVSVDMQPINTWTEPAVPSDILQALSAHPKAKALWQAITPLARWEWVRWIRSTANQTTRLKRIEVACSKLENGKRRPCCWNRNLCSEPSVCKSGVLHKPRTLETNLVS